MDTLTVLVGVDVAVAANDGRKDFIAGDLQNGLINDNK